MHSKMIRVIACATMAEDHGAQLHGARNNFE